MVLFFPGFPVCVTGLSCLGVPLNVSMSGRFQEFSSGLHIDMKDRWISRQTQIYYSVCRRTHKTKRKFFSDKIVFISFSRNIVTSGRTIFPFMTYVLPIDPVLCRPSFTDLCLSNLTIFSPLKPSSNKRLKSQYDSDRST